MSPPASSLVSCHSPIVLYTFAPDCLLLGIIGAVAGYPNITVPAGRIKDLPVGLSFVGTRFSEPVLIQAAYAYEQANRHATTLEGQDPWVLEQRWASQQAE